MDFERFQRFINITFLTFSLLCLPKWPFLKLFLSILNSVQKTFSPKIPFQRKNHQVLQKARIADGGYHEHGRFFHFSRDGLRSAHQRRARDWSRLHKSLHIAVHRACHVRSHDVRRQVRLLTITHCINNCHSRYSKRERYEDILQGLKELPDKIKRVLELDSEIHKMAEDMKDQRSVLVMGRGYNYATCLEGALKIKEITYMHSEGILAGELKHGPVGVGLCILKPS